MFCVISRTVRLIKR